MYTAIDMLYTSLLNNYNIEADIYNVSLLLCVYIKPIKRRDHFFLLICDPKVKLHQGNLNGLIVMHEFGIFINQIPVS